MTDYSARNSKHIYNNSFSKWKVIFMVFVVCVLLLAALNGLFKLKNLKFVDNSRNSWDGIASFLVAVNGSEDYLAVFQVEPNRIALFKFGDRFGSNVDMESVVKSLSGEGGVVVRNYLVDNSEEGFLEDIQNFTSYITPLKIVLGRYKDMNTNISRYEAIKLWWQTKSISVNDENIRDISVNYNGARQVGVMGIKSDQLRRNLVPYVENIKILDQKNMDVTIVNKSDNEQAAILMESFITSVGGRVTKIVGSTDLIDKCIVIGEKTYLRDYLENMFGCDIKEPTFGQDSQENLTIVVGQEFIASYF